MCQTSLVLTTKQKYATTRAHFSQMLTIIAALTCILLVISALAACYEFLRLVKKKLNRQFDHDAATAATTSTEVTAADGSASSSSSVSSVRDASTSTTNDNDSNVNDDVTSQANAASDSFGTATAAAVFNYHLACEHYYATATACNNNYSSSSRDYSPQQHQLSLSAPAQYPVRQHNQQQIDYEFVPYYSAATHAFVPMPMPVTPLNTPTQSSFSQQQEVPMYDYSPSAFTNSDATETIVPIVEPMSTLVNVKSTKERNSIGQVACEMIVYLVVFISSLITVHAMYTFNYFELLFNTANDLYSAHVTMSFTDGIALLAFIYACFHCGLLTTLYSVKLCRSYKRHQQQQLANPLKFPSLCYCFLKFVANKSSMLVQMMILIASFLWVAENFDFQSRNVTPTCREEIILYMHIERFSFACHCFLLLTMAAETCRLYSSKQRAVANGSATAKSSFDKSIGSYCNLVYVLAAAACVLLISCFTYSNGWFLGVKCFSNFFSSERYGVLVQAQLICVFCLAYSAVTFIHNALRFEVQEVRPRTTHKDTSTNTEAEASTYPAHV